MARLLLVSYRLPVTVRVEPEGVTVTPSMGGVATGLKGPHEQGGGWWTGWPGDVSKLAPERRAELDRKLEERRLLPLYLSDAEHRRFYEGFANRTLRPVFQYPIDKSLAVGHDQTDEDMFAALPDGSHTICVGTRPTRARYAVADHPAARGLLGQLL